MIRIPIAMKKWLKKIKFPKIKFPGKKFWLGKKFLICAGLAIVVVFGGIFIANGTKKTSMYNTALANVAEARHYMKTASTANMELSFFSGMREEPYSQDGKAGKQMPFAILNLVVKDDSLKDFQQIDGTVLIDNEQISIILVRNPYDVLNFATDIARTVDVNKSIEVTLFISSTNQPTIKLENAMDESSIDWKGALRAATEKIGDKIKGSKFEVYVKIVDNMAKDSNAYWYVQFITDTGKIHSCVIAPDGSIVG